MTKTLREDSRFYAGYSLATESLIHEFNYAVRSSPHSKRYNAPTSMRAVVDNDIYFCMTIPNNQAAQSGRLQENHHVSVV